MKCIDRKLRVWEGCAQKTQFVPIFCTLISYTFFSLFNTTDTDVGSQIDDSFDLDDSFDNNCEDKNEDLDAILTNNNLTTKNKKNEREASLSPHKTTQMAAKVRRLNLNSDDNNVVNVSGDNTNGSRYSNGSMDVKRAMEIARQSFLEEEGEDESDDDEIVTKVTNSKKRIGYAPKHTTTRRASPPGHGSSGGGGSEEKGLFGSSYEMKISAARVSNESSSSADMNMAAPCRNSSYGPPPPSTIKKKKGRSRLFHNDDDEDDMDMNVRGEGMNVETKFKFGGGYDMKDEDEDVSPRDALDFPFSTASSSSPKRASQKENSSLTSSTATAKEEGDRNNNKSYEAMTSSSSINTNYQSINSPPRFQAPPSSSSSNHPSTAKRSNQSRSVVDRGDMFVHPQPTNINLLNSTAAASSTSNSNGGIVERPLVPQRPMGLRSIGRANSFLQMFSQGSIDSGNGSMRSIDEDKGNGVNLNFGDDNSDDDGDDFMLHTTNNRPKPPQRNDSILSVGATINTSDMITCPSPQRPMRKAHKSRYTPASPVNNNNNTSGDNNNNAFSRFVNDFEIVGTLGNGSFGSVYSVRNRTDQRLYAIKAAKREARNSTDRNRMLQEVYALSALSDKACMSSMHIVRYHQAWMEGNRLYIQTELCETTLLHEMKNTTNRGGKTILLDEKRRYKLLREMLLALDLVHKSNMIHLDIKPENIFIKNNQYKLGDFGLVGKTEGKHDDVEEGDSRYMSPELLSGELDDLTKVCILSFWCMKLT